MIPLCLPTGTAHRSCREKRVRSTECGAAGRSKFFSCTEMRDCNIFHVNEMPRYVQVKTDLHCPDFRGRCSGWLSGVRPSTQSAFARNSPLTPFSCHLLLSPIPF